ncbi:MAG: tRNA (cmo5U34)-methyltransferase [Solirubrobacteraceae bacterium]|nr:tRNA (cmo5U34)-methyltransferase [Solirubrobacteraceae bacterium]
MTDVTSVFDAHARDYDAVRRRLIPPYDAFYGTAVDALSLARRPVRRVLDVGAGTGLLAARVLAALPDAEVTLLDGAPAMLEEARARLGDGASYVHGDFSRDLPDGPWDAVVSSLAIHHLDDAGKQELTRRIHDALAPGGLFVNAEQVAGPTELLQRRYEAWHERSSRALGASDEEWGAARERMTHDRCSPVADQLRWMREAGFQDVDCLFKDHNFAVLAGRRA